MLEIELQHDLSRPKKAKRRCFKQRMRRYETKSRGEKTFSNHLKIIAPMLAKRNKLKGP
jgi:hypothetical protein